MNRLIDLTQLWYNIGGGISQLQLTYFNQNLTFGPGAPLNKKIIIYKLSQEPADVKSMLNFYARGA